MTRKSNKKLNSLWSRTVQGSWVSGAFFAQYWLQIFVAIVMVLVYITNRYSCQRSMEEIRRLNDRLVVVQSESYRIRGIYMGRTRESALKEKVQEAGLDLSVQNKPPYQISSSSPQNADK